jgi:hypothetical protein
LCFIARTGLDDATTPSSRRPGVTTEHRQTAEQQNCNQSSFFHGSTLCDVKVPDNFALTCQAWQWGSRCLTEENLAIISGLRFCMATRRAVVSGF